MYIIVILKKQMYLVPTSVILEIFIRLDCNKFMILSVIELF